MSILNQKFPEFSKDLSVQVRTKDLLKLLDVSYLVDLFYEKVSE